MANSEQTIHELMENHAQPGTVTWIGVRPERHAPIDVRSSVEALTAKGLMGDRYKTTRNGKRQVTIVQAEHLPVMASILDLEAVTPEQLRRNLLVDRINVLALKNKRFAIGDVILEGTGLCAPCSQMEATFGPGGYNAMRGHGGITARILEGGEIRLGDPVRLLVE
ncbi:MAG: MOSC domain-containing protein YiiM [Bradymonadia bacterium]|jgi:MOSC domain-containing protein YiiM